MKTNLAILLVTVGQAANPEISQRLIRTGNVRLNDKVVQKCELQMYVDDVVSVGRQRSFVVTEEMLNNGVS